MRVRFLGVGFFLLLLATSVAEAQQPGQPAVPGLSDTAVIIIGTVLSLLVIYAIIAAHLRKEE